MCVRLVILSFLVLNTASKPRDSKETIDRAFRRYNIVPQIIPVSPPSIITEIFNDHVANLGDTIPVEGTIIKPYTTFTNVHYNRFYTLIALDDGGSRDRGNQFVWGCVANIPGPFIRRGDTLAPYVAPNPIPGKGAHRYMTFIYLQRRRISITTDLVASVSKNIRNFNITEFVLRLKLGDPIAGTFFLSRQSLPKPTCQKPSCQYSVPKCNYDTIGVDVCCQGGCI